MSEVLTDALAALQAAFDEVLPDAKRALAREDELLDLGIGSIAALEIAGTLQTRYELEIQDADLFELRTVGDFVALIERRVQAAAPAKPDPTKEQPEER